MRSSAKDPAQILQRLSLALALALGLSAAGTAEEEDGADEAVAPAQTAPAEAAASSGGQEGDRGPASCMECHGDLIGRFEKSTHGRAADPRSPASTKSCATCHGDLQEHVAKDGEAGAVPKRFTAGGLSVAERNESCLKCHSSGTRRHWEDAKHKGKGVSCTDCHSVHKGHAKNLAKEDESKTCLQCHLNKVGEFNRTSHHPIKEGKVKCSDCHNPHGTIDERNLRTASLNETCFKCHADKRGPFLFEHRPVAENCATCHMPHGSIHSKMLKSKPPFLCQSCHSVSRHPGTIYAINPAAAGSNTYQRGSSRLLYRSCLNCHNMVHGSNHPGGKFYLR